MLLQVHGMEILNLILGCQLRDLFLGGTKTIGKREARGGIRTKDLRLSKVQTSITNNVKRLTSVLFLWKDEA